METTEAPKVEEKRVKKEPVKGLKALRAVKDRAPGFICENCKCKRYSKCGCKRNS